MIIAGLDLSLTETGYVFLKVGETSLSSIIEKQGVIKTPLKAEARLDFILKTVIKLVVEMQPLLICIENYSFGSKFNLPQAGELAGLIKHFLWKNKFNFKLVSPHELKKFVCGKGGVKKEVILLHTYKRYNETFENNNICDAFVLSKIAEAIINQEINLTDFQEIIIKNLNKK